MSKWCRTAPTQSIKLTLIGRPFSNFQYIENNNLAVVLPMRRLLSQVRQHNGQTLVEEMIAPAEEVREEDEDLARLNPNFVGSVCLG